MISDYSKARVMLFEVNSSIINCLSSEEAKSKSITRL